MTGRSEIRLSFLAFTTSSYKPAGACRVSRRTSRPVSIADLRPEDAPVERSWPAPRSVWSPPLAAWNVSGLGGDPSMTLPMSGTFGVAD